MNEDEIKKLVATCKKMEDNLMLDLSGRQLDWMYDLFDYCEKGRFDRFSENAINFLQGIEMGNYTTLG